MITATLANNAKYGEINLKDVLTKSGFGSLKKIIGTLQGSIWKAIYQPSNEKMVIKITSKYLHTQRINTSNVVIEENILLEKTILEYLTIAHNKNIPNCITKYKGFFQSNLNFFLVMVDGGSCLFDFCVNVHKDIVSGKLDIAEWHKMAKVIFKQMIECIQYIHSMNVCHFDISLENFLINDVKVVFNQNGKIEFCTDNVRIKICDFGLAEVFEANSDFMSTKYCGKNNYKSNECTEGKKRFSAKSNDVWCVGVCLFMLIIGGGPFNKACKSDNKFVKIINGDIVNLLKEWNKIKYVNNDLIELFEMVFKYENKRCKLSDMLQCKWLNA